MTAVKIALVADEQDMFVFPRAAFVAEIVVVLSLVGEFFLFNWHP
jgi:hypothetical protein